MRTLLKEIHDAFRSQNVSMNAGDWIKEIPREPGWYILATDTPWHVLATLTPLQEAKGHYRIGDRASRADALLSLGVLIEAKENTVVPVYNGHAKNLQTRARSHWNGHHRTGCLALKQYRELEPYRWEFHFAPVSALRSRPLDSYALRNIGEQLWRAEHGWPILCVE